MNHLQTTSQVNMSCKTQVSKSGLMKGSKAATPFLNNALGMVATRFERINDCWLASSTPRAYPHCSRWAGATTLMRLHACSKGSSKHSLEGPSDRLLWLGTLPNQLRIRNLDSSLTNSKSILWVALLTPSPLMHADRAAVLSK